VDGPARGPRAAPALVAEHHLVSCSTPSEHLPRPAAELLLFPQCGATGIYARNSRCFKCKTPRPAVRYTAAAAAEVGWLCSACLDRPWPASIDHWAVLASLDPHPPCWTGGRLWGAGVGRRRGRLG
jgi:hypothetical protein